MSVFMDHNFLLKTATAQKLYHEVAKTLPIIDYHCHIDPRVLAENRRFETMTEAWLGGDHYKWRVMRACRVPETLITGDGDDREKFRAYCSIMPLLARNPLHHWSHWELRRYFGVDELICRDSADAIYDACNEKLRDMPALELLKMVRVRVLGTTDDPADDLRHHDRIANDASIELGVFPTFRPDNLVNIEKAGFADYVACVERLFGQALDTVDEVVAFLSRRVEFFDARGCRAADHGLDSCVFEEPSPELADRALTKKRSGAPLDPQEANVYKTSILLALAERYCEKNWAMQIHFGCARNVNHRRFCQLGPDTGFDAVNGSSGAENLAPLLNAMARDGRLPKVIAYSLNPQDNAVIDTILSCFQGEPHGAVAHGSAWWFNDNKTGMEEHMIALANNGVLGNFLGMLTDSRSLLSYTRHDYFRRIFCNLVGRWVEDGEYPDDEGMLKRLLEGVCVRNAAEYFGWESFL